MKLVLIHGMGRTPLSMLLLHHRLKRLGYDPHLFGYSPTFESLDRVADRLYKLIYQKIHPQPYALIGHSLGSVIIRYAASKLNDFPPVACFFLAPPMVACRAAKFFTRFWPCRIATGEMGQLLAQEQFMAQLVMPNNAKIYAGTRGPRATWLPFGNEYNDCVLTLDEATGPFAGDVVKVPAPHPLIMNSTMVAKDIGTSLAELSKHHL